MNLFIFSIEIIDFIHTRFFEEIQGVPTEVVYDNARVQVTYLAERERQPTEAVKKLTNYYRYAARYTNPYSGHEKGHVERSVELIRRKAYSKCHRFKTIADAVTALLDATTRENQKVKQQTNQSSDAVFAQEQKHKYHLVILDELGYISFDKEGAELLFNLISTRCEKLSTMFTTNLPFSRWNQIFHDPIITAAMVDRITHQSYVINMKGTSYRLQQSKKFLESE